MIFVLCIIAIACTTGVLTEYFKSKAKREKSAVGDDTLAQIDALEERIRVLERIVTENKFDLRREIDRL
jgi:hypothetical protein